MFVKDVVVRPGVPWPGDSETYPTNSGFPGEELALQVERCAEFIKAFDKIVPLALASRLRVIKAKNST